jgi:hypothetical protein
MTMPHTAPWHPSDQVSDALTFVFVGWLTGVSYGNRQAALRRLRVGQQVQVVREPDNPQDPNACAVYTLGGDNLGYVPRDDAADVAAAVDSGDVMIGYVGRVGEMENSSVVDAYVWLGCPRVRRRTKDSLDPKSLPPAGWHPDPSGRHETRYWNGAVWTEYVADQGRQTLDAV